jgi:hypothetical protein
MGIPRGSKRNFSPEVRAACGERIRLARIYLPRCSALTVQGEPCKMQALKGQPKCWLHTSVTKRAELGYPKAIALLQRAAMARAAPEAVKQLPLWKCLGVNQRVVLLEGWHEEVEQGVHGAWWAAVRRVLEWRQRKREVYHVKSWPTWLRRPLIGTGGATPVPPTVVSCPVEETELHSDELF